MTRGRKLTGRTTPCMGCEDRHSHCHSECEKYAEFRARVEAEAKVKAKEHLKDAYFFDKMPKKQR